MKRALTVPIAVCAIGVAALHGQQPSSRIHKLEELRWPQIDALDRDRTMFILPMGMLEEHGPHLPIGADSFGVGFEADAAVTSCRPCAPAMERGDDAADRLRDSRCEPDRRPPGASGDLWNPPVDASIDRRRGRRTSRAQPVQVGLRADRPRRAAQRRRGERGLRLRQRELRRDDAARERPLSRRRGDSGTRQSGGREVFLAGTESLRSASMSMRA